MSAVGSLKEKYEPLHMVIPDQFVDRTRQRIGRRSSVTGSSPTSPSPTPSARTSPKVLDEACAEAGVTHHVGGSYVCIEGPQFSTRAESELYRSWGMDLVGMTNLQEARLAREAEICYATLAMVTDYDCWHPEHDSVTAEQILGNLSRERRDGQGVLQGALFAACPRLATASARRRSSSRS